MGGLKKEGQKRKKGDEHSWRSFRGMEGMMERGREGGKTDKQVLTKEKDDNGGWWQRKKKGEESDIEDARQERKKERKKEARKACSGPNVMQLSGKNEMKEKGRKGIESDTKRRIKVRKGGISIGKKHCRKGRARKV